MLDVMVRRRSLWAIAEWNGPPGPEPGTDFKERAKGKMEHNNYIEMIEAIRDHAKVVDLSYTMEMNMPFWPTQPKYEAAVVETYEVGGESYHQSIRISEHTGTHIDSPAHLFSEGKTLDQYAVSSFSGSGWAIDCSGLAGEIGPDALDGVPAADFLLFYTVLWTLHVI